VVGPRAAALALVGLAALAATAAPAGAAPAAPGFRVRTLDGARTIDSRAQGVTCPVALDPRLAVANRFGLRGTPYTVVIDTRGEMVARLHGGSAVARLPRILDRLLAERPRAR
jgi:hypothetical protein